MKKLLTWKLLCLISDAKIRAFWAKNKKTGKGLRNLLRQGSCFTTKACQKGFDCRKTTEIKLARMRALILKPCV